MILFFTNVKIDESTFYYWVALVALTLNILNIVFWSFGWYVPSTVNLALIAIFCFFCKKNLSNGILLLIFLVFALLILGKPVSSWDARSIWFFHAKRIFIDNNLYAQLDNYATWSHNDYPILFPSIAASMAKTVGYWNEIYPRLGVLLISFPVFLIFKILLKNNLGFNLWVIGILLICGRLLYNGYMDAMLAIYCAAATVILAVISESRNLEHKGLLIKSTTLLMLILAILPFIKNEGLLASLLIFAISLPLLYKNYTYILGTILLSLIYFKLWRFELLSRSVHSDLFGDGMFDRGIARLTSPSEMFQIFRVLVATSWMYFLVFFVVWRCKLLNFSIARTSMLFPIGYLSAIVAVYCITPYDLLWHLNTSANRTFLTINVCFYSLLALLLSRRMTDKDK